MKKIPMEDLEARRVYRLASRNLVVGAWRPSTRGFVGIREKFSSIYLFEEYHADADPHMGTVAAMEPMDAVVPEGMELSEDSDDLLAWMLEVEKPILEACRAEGEARQGVLDLKMFSPPTREEVERAERVAAVKEWWRVEREVNGRGNDPESWRALIPEFVQKMKEAHGE